MALAAATPPLPSENAKKLSNDLFPDQMKSKWERRDVIYASVLFVVHFLALFAPFTFSWSLLQVAFVRYVLHGVLGVTICYHRCLTHLSFKIPKPLEYLLAFFGFLALQGDPIFWVSTHRQHHKTTDTEKDPHTPNDGFWYSHISWTFSRNSLKLKGANYGNVADLTSQAYYRFLQKRSDILVLLYVVVLYSLGGFPYLVWGIGVPTTWGYHVTFLVNSACHTWGQQPWKTNDLSRNNWAVAILTFGEGWHNNHHAFEFSARQGLEWWQLDPSWYIIKLLESLGVATNVKLPTQDQKEKMSFKNGKENMKLL